MRKKVAKQPYEGYTLPESSERGGKFIDWNSVLRESVGVAKKKPLKIVKKRRDVKGKDK